VNSKFSTTSIRAMGNLDKSRSGVEWPFVTASYNRLWSGLLREQVSAGVISFLHAGP
jgi:hypothetical protein